MVALSTLLVVRMVHVLVQLTSRPISSPVICVVMAPSRQDHISFAIGFVKSKQNLPLFVSQQNCHGIILAISLRRYSSKSSVPVSGRLLFTVMTGPVSLDFPLTLPLPFFATFAPAATVRVVPPLDSSQLHRSLLHVILCLPGC